MLIIIVWMRPGCDCGNLLQFKNAAELGPRTQTVQEASVHLQREVLQFDTVPLSTTRTHVSSSNLVLFAPKTATDPSFPAHISLSSLQISACKSSPSHRRNSHDEIQCAQIICLSAFLPFWLVAFKLDDPHLWAFFFLFHPSVHCESFWAKKIQQQQIEKKRRRRKDECKRLFFCVFCFARSKAVKSWTPRNININRCGVFTRV